MFAGRDAGWRAAALVNDTIARANHFAALFDVRNFLFKVGSKSRSLASLISRPVASRTLMKRSFPAITSGHSKFQSSYLIFKVFFHTSFELRFKYCLACVCRFARLGIFCFYLIFFFWRNPRRAVTRTTSPGFRGRRGCWCGHKRCLSKRANRINENWWSLLPLR